MLDGTQCSNTSAGSDIGGDVMLAKNIVWMTEPAVHGEIGMLSIPFNNDTSRGKWYFRGDALLPTAHGYQQQGTGGATQVLTARSCTSFSSKEYSSVSIHIL